MSENPSNNQEEADELQVSQTEAKAKSRGFPWVPLLVLGLFILWPALDFVSLATNFVQAKRTKAWSETTGEVISYDIRVRGESNEDGRAYYYLPVLNYTYVVDGKSYESDHISYDMIEYSTNDAARGVIGHISADGEIPVFYNSGDPQQSVLARGVAASDTAYFRLSFYCVLLIVFAAISGVKLAAERVWTGFICSTKIAGRVGAVMLVIGTILVIVYEPGIDQDAIPKEWTYDTSVTIHVPRQAGPLKIAQLSDEDSKATLWVLFGLAGLSVVGYNIHMFLTCYRIAALVRVTPTTPLKEIGPGFREIRATLKAQKAPLKSPITGVRCAQYSVEVTQAERSGEHTRTVTVGTKSDSCPVYFEDGTGKLDVSLDDFEFVDLDINSKVIGKNDKDLQDKMRQLFDIDSARGLDVTETVLPVDRKYFAFGHVSKEMDGQFLLTNGPEGSFLTSKDESKLLDWMDSRVFRAKSYAVLFAIATLSPLAFLIKSEQLGSGIVLVMVLVVPIAILAIHQRGKKYELTGEL